MCDLALFATVKGFEGHLFDAFIPAAYRDYRSLGSRRWTAARAERWLVYLAKHLNNDLGGTTDLAWWELWHAAPRQLSGIVTGLISGLAIGIAAWLGPGLGIGIGVGLIISLSVGIAVRVKAGFFGGIVGGITGGAAGGILGGFIGGLIGGSAATTGLVGGLALGIGVGPVSGLVGGFLGCVAGGIGVGLTAGHGAGLAAGLVDGLGAAAAAALCSTVAGRRTPAADCAGFTGRQLGWASGRFPGSGLASRLVSQPDHPPGWPPASRSASCQRSHSGLRATVQSRSSCRSKHSTGPRPHNLPDYGIRCSNYFRTRWRTRRLDRGRDRSCNRSRPWGGLSPGCLWPLFGRTLLARATPLPALAADGLPRRCSQTWRAPSSWRLLSIPSCRTATKPGR